jgi:hypothetical protein
MEIHTEKIKGNFLKTALPRFFLFIITYLITVISAFGRDAILFIFLLPAGLSAFLFQDATDTPAMFSIFLVWPILIGWAIYISISIIGIMAKNRYVFIVVYIIFIFLLITNVESCKVATAGLSS